MLRFLITLAIFLSSQFVSANAQVELYQECKNRVTNANYGSQQWEITCSEMFDMAKPYLIKCANFVKNGFPDKIEQASCQLFCQNNKQWGPWYDYELAYDLKDIVLEMKRRHNNGTCQKP